MMKLDDWVFNLKYIAEHRKTYYSNKYPANCGEIHQGGILSFDCIGLVKSVINDPSITYKTSPVGFFVKPAQVIPDVSEIDILNLCSDVVWGDFRNVTNGEYLYMSGHAGVYFSGNPDVNVIECTTAWSGGVVASWVDPDGTRRSWREGAPLGKWEAHGKLSKYIDYSQPKPQKKSITTIAKEVIAGKWGNYPERKTRLEKAGYNYAKVQAKVDELVAAQNKPKKKSITAIAKEVIDGKWGNYPERKTRLEKAGYNYAEVQAKVDQLLKQ